MAAASPSNFLFNLNLVNSSRNWNFYSNLLRPKNKIDKTHSHFCNQMLKQVYLELNKKNFICPKPIPNRDNNYISSLDNKNFMIATYLEGKSKHSLSPNECGIVGKEIANYILLLRILLLKEQMTFRLSLGEKFLLK